MRSLLALFLLFLASAALAEGAKPQATQRVQRFALVVGANNGGLGRPTLRYAATDAQSFIRVMDHLGGLPEEHRTVLFDPTVPAFSAALASLGQQLKAARGQSERLEVFFYYSGHADELGLLLGGQRVPYSLIREQVDALDADVRIAIVDACASGALTRGKGGVRKPPFLMDQASKVRGSAFLTSASADEAAQESDRIRASFFSHALVSGLRGAADASGDGRVTLNEAYQFAFQETLARTQGTQMGAQHPSYDMQLVGTGDVVMTDLRGSAAAMALDKSLTGRIFVRDQRGGLVAELQKPAGRPIELGLDAGVYQLTLDTPAGEKRHGTVLLTEGKRTAVRLDILALAPAELTRARGGEVSAEGESYLEPVGFSLVPGVATDGRDSRRALSLNLLGGQIKSVDTAEVGLIFNLVEEDVRHVQVAGALNVVGGDMEGAQIALGANAVTGRMTGAQIAPGLTSSVGPMSGAQVTAGVAYAGESVVGAQVAAGAAVTWGPVEGAQVAAGATLARGRVDGAQIAAGGAIALEDVDGAQIAAGAALAVGLVDGLQIAPFTFAHDIDGCQIGVVNVARGKVSGCQIGVFNYADEVDGASIGLIPWVNEGRHDVRISGNELMAGNLGLVLGSDHFHTQFFAGVNPFEGKERWETGLGVGGHITLGDFWLDLELAQSTVVDGWNNSDVTEKLHLLSTGRVLAGYQFASQFAVFAGPSWNLLVTPEGHDELELEFEPLIESEHNGAQIRQWLGVVVGVQI